MQSRLVKTLPIWLLLLAAGPSWAIDQHVTVGGTSDGGYYGGMPILMFSPSQLTISVGDSVTFTNAGGAHNVHADDDSFRCAQGCDGQGGNGDPSTEAWTTSITFNHAGTFAYHCDNHASYGMTGTIIVQDATTPPAHVPITGGFTGAWFDHTQGGHGIFLPNNFSCDVTGNTCVDNRLGGLHLSDGGGHTITNNILGVVATTRRQIWP